MKRLGSLFLCLALLSSCTDSTPRAVSDDSDAEELLRVLSSEDWTQDVPSELAPFSTIRTSKAANADSVGVVGLSSHDDTEEGGGRIVASVTYVVFGSDEQASTAVDDFVSDFDDHEDARPLEDRPGICVIDADRADECTTAQGSVMVRVLLRNGPQPDEALTEELVDLALAHLEAVKEGANL